MEHVQWDLPAPVGIPGIDEQHRKLHGLLMKLFGTLATDPDGALSEFRFIRLAEQTAQHFQWEEDYLRSIGYPDLTAHRDDHEFILERIRKNLTRWDAPGGPRLFDLVEDYAESIQRHADRADHAVGAWVEAQYRIQADPGRS